MGAIDGADDVAFGPAVRANRAQFNENLVAVHGRTDERAVG